MAKKKNHKGSEFISSDVKQSILALFIILIGIIVTISIFQGGGIVGKFTLMILKNIFGVGMYIIPIFFIIFGCILLFRSTNTKILYLRLIFVTLITGSIIGLIHLLQFPSIQDGMEASRLGLGGGLFGQLIYYLVGSLLGRVGAIILLLTLIVIFVLIIFNTAIHLDFIVDFIKDALFNRNHKESIGVDNSSSVTKMTKQEVDALMESESISNNTNESGAAGRIFKNNILTSNNNLKESTSETKSNSEIKESKLNPIKDINFSLPGLELLDLSEDKEKPKSGDLKKNAEIIKSTLATFGIEVEMGKVDVGPSVTRYMLRPFNGVKLSRITSLQNDLALALAAQAIRIEAPIPGMSYVGIEIPNEKRSIVRIRDILSSKEFEESKFQLPLVLGKNVMNKVVVFPLEKMPHLLIAGATGAGKSMGLNAMILSMLYRNPPSQLKLLFVDPKRVELSTYNGIPHLLTPAIVSPEKAMNSLNWCVSEMERRYEVLSKAGSRNIFTYNELVVKQKNNLDKLDEDEDILEYMPFIVVVIDELADLMTTHKKEVEGAIVRIAQMARAVGIHLILATQRPSTDVITGLIKANLPSRISFQVASQIDSRTILDTMGAEKLLGMGDMLFVGGDLAKSQRIQGPLVPEHEVKAVVEYLKSQSVEEYNDSITEATVPKTFYQKGGDQDLEGADNLFEEAKDLVLQTKKGSASLLQRRLKIGYARAARILDELEEAGIVGPADGSKPREVYGDNYESNSDDQI